MKKTTVASQSQKPKAVAAHPGVLGKADQGALKADGMSLNQARGGLMTTDTVVAVDLKEIQTI